MIKFTIQPPGFSPIPYFRLGNSPTVPMASIERVIQEFEDATPVGRLPETRDDYLITIEVVPDPEWVSALKPL